MKAARNASQPGEPRLVVVDDATFDALPCCGIKNATHPGRCEKRCWLQENAKFGLRAKTLQTGDDQAGGYIEFIPGEFAWRGVYAPGYMFIHCIWMHARLLQRQGWGSFMIEDCLAEARGAGMHGAAVIARNGPWLADRRLFLANGFELVDTALPDYELLVRKFDAAAPDPVFVGGFDVRIRRYGRGLTLVRSKQCPHIAKFASEIAQAATEEYRIKPRVIELQSYRDAQNAPTPYAVFALIYNGRLLADHQISRTRFRNIMGHLRT